MGLGFCLVFLRVVVGVGIDEVFFLVGVWVIFVMSFECFVIVLVFVIEYFLEWCDLVGWCYQLVEIVMVVFMLEMFQQCVIWFGYLFVCLFVVGGIGFGNVDGDDVIGMFGQYLFVMWKVLQEFEGQVGFFIFYFWYWL